MRRDPYHRRSVWIDILGVLLTGAVLLGGAGYVLYHAGDATRGMSGGFSQGSRAPSMMQGSRTARPSRSSGGRGMQSGAVRPFLSSRSSSSPSGAAAPFSEEWRTAATPSLTEPSASSGEISPGAGDASARFSVTGNSASRSFGQSGDGRPRYGAADRSVGSEWRAEARLLGGKARALSSQLGQLNRQSNAQESTTGPSSRTAGSGSGADARTADRDVPPPPSVPIDDHLHWLLVAGVLWGAWRLWRGG